MSHRDVICGICDIQKGRAERCPRGYHCQEPRTWALAPSATRAVLQERAGLQHDLSFPCFSGIVIQVWGAVSQCVPATPCTFWPVAAPGNVPLRAVDSLMAALAFCLSSPDAFAGKGVPSWPWSHPGLSLLQRLGTTALATSARRGVLSQPGSGGVIVFPR